MPLHRPIPPTTETDWKRLREMSDEDIAHAVKHDPDAAPILTPEDLKTYKPTPPKITPS